MANLHLSTAIVKPKSGYIAKLLSDGLTYSGERYKALPFIVRYGFYELNIQNKSGLTDFVVSWVRLKGNKFVKDARSVYSKVRKLVSDHIDWACARRKSVALESLEPLVDAVVSETVVVFSPQNALRDSSLKKLRDIVVQVVEYIYTHVVNGIAAIPKVVFTRAGAYDGGKTGLCHYLNIRRALERLGILKSLDITTFAGGPCQQYKVDLGDYMKFIEDDGFVDRKAKKKSRGAKKVSKYDKYSSDILGDDVLVSGSEIVAFVKAYEKKLRNYLDKPFLTLIENNTVRGTSKFPYYVRGAAVCKKYEFDVSRFIEAQFYFYNEWKGEAPDIKYVTSVYSDWNSVGRYREYCDKFSEEIDYFGDGADNVVKAVKSSYKKTAPKVSEQEQRQKSETDFYRIKDSLGFGNKEIYLHYGHPLKPILSLYFLKTQAGWLKMLRDNAWGESVTTKFFESPSAGIVLD